MKQLLKMLGGLVTFLVLISWLILDLILSFIILFALGWTERYIFRDRIHFIVDEDNVYNISVIWRGRSLIGKALDCESR